MLYFCTLSKSSNYADQNTSTQVFNTVEKMPTSFSIDQLIDQLMSIDKQEKYLTSQEFWNEADKRIIKICEQYGVLQ